LTTEKRPRRRTRTRWRDYVSHLAWERLWVPQEELERVAGQTDVWVSDLGHESRISFLEAELSMSLM